MSSKEPFRFSNIVVTEVGKLLLFINLLFHVVQ